MVNYSIFVLSLLALVCALAFASEPSPLQDFCVADPASPALVNGRACLDSKLTQADHFFVSGLDKAGNTSNALGSVVTPVTVGQIPGLNTFGIALARLDYAPKGLIPPHSHPRATEILTVLEGSLYVGFVTSNPENRLISKVLKKGDVFVFPMGLVHFQQNVDNGMAISLSALSSQNPGFITVASAVFGSKPSIGDDILAKAFQVDQSAINYFRSTVLAAGLINTRNFSITIILCICFHSTNLKELLKSMSSFINEDDIICCLPCL